MPTPTLRGNDNPIRQKRNWTFNANSGGSYIEEYRGINLAKMIAQWNGTVYTAQSGELAYENGVATMRLEWATAGGGGGGTGNNNSIEVTTDRWECPEPRFDKPLLQHPTMTAIIIALAGAESGGDSWANRNKIAKNIREAINAAEDFKTSMAASCAGWTAFAAGVYYEPLLRLAQMMISGQDSYQSSQYAIRHTTNAPGGWGLNRADVAVNKIYSQAQFLSEVTDSSLWYFPMPGRLQYKLAAAYTAFAALAPSLTGYAVGWLKGPSAESSAANGRVEIQTNYVLDQWSTDIYAQA